MGGKETGQKRRNILDRRVPQCQGLDSTPSCQAQILLLKFLQFLLCLNARGFSEPCSGPSSPGSITRGMSDPLSGLRGAPLSELRAAFTCDTAGCSGNQREKRPGMGGIYGRKRRPPFLGLDAVRNEI